MHAEYRTADWDSYRMVYAEPHRRLEPPEREVAVVDEALDALLGAGILPHAEYDHEKFLAHRRAIAERFDIPWTAISPRMQRLIYAINAIVRPANLIAAGVFCGNTFISNAGAAVGPGAVYEANRAIGVEIQPDEAERAERNVRTIDPTGTAKVVATDAVPYTADFDGSIELLYIDASDPERGKCLYLDILRAGWEHIPDGGVILAHNSVDSADDLGEYLDFVRDEDNCRASVNVVLDPAGLEVSIR